MKTRKHVLHDGVTGKSLLLLSAGSRSAGCSMSSLGGNVFALQLELGSTREGGAMKREWRFRWRKGLRCGWAAVFAYYVSESNGEEERAGTSKDLRKEQRQVDCGGVVGAVRYIATRCCV